MESVFEEIRAIKCNPMVEIWYCQGDIDPIKNGRLDIMYGASLDNRQLIQLPLTEVMAVWSPVFDRWDYKYGGGWFRCGKSPIHLNGVMVWY